MKCSWAAFWNSATPDQYQANVATRCEGNERVEYAVLLPGREDGGQGVWLPIDAKFPLRTISVFWKPKNVVTRRWLRRQGAPSRLGRCCS